MHSEEDRENIVALGVPPGRTLVLGSSKYDGLMAKAHPEKAARWRKLLEIPPGLPVVVGGSLRRSECTRILEIFLALQRAEPQLVGLFAPRHMDRIPQMVEWLQGRGAAFQLLTDLENGKEARRSSIVLVDRIGVLFEIYSLGDLIFCGGTFEPIGGHNILEPAAWGKPVFYGPHLQKVLYEHNILQSFEGSFLVRDAQDLLGQWSHWVQDLSGLEVHGKRAAEALTKLGGVAARQVELIMDALS
jgi:3-deoxy-D-manno-octulosonic-acid transferase